MKQTGNVALAFVLALLCSGCGGDAEREGVGGISPGEAQALNDAAEMLDARSEVPTTDQPALNPAAQTARKVHRPGAIE